jgi:hypothetical protein
LRSFVTVCGCPSGWVLGNAAEESGREVTRDITEGGAVSGSADGKDDPEKRLEEERRRRLLDAEIDAELAGLVAGPPWQPVMVGESADLVAAYRQARMLVEQLRARLVAAGLTAEEFPYLCCGVGFDGRPVVDVGAVSMVTAQRLAVVLGRRPGPPAERGKGRAA